MRLATWLLSMLLLTAGGGVAAAPLPTSLSITVYPNGIGAAGAHRYVLRCGRPGGTVPNPSLACRTLARLAHPFAPTPPGPTCSYISLGPDEAVVVGRLRGARVDARLTVRNSCEIARWRRLAAVVPGFPGRR